MKVTIDIDAAFPAPEAVIRTASMTEEVQEAAAWLHAQDEKVLRGYSERGVELLRPQELLRLYSEKQKIFAQTDRGVFQVRQRMYELEEELDKTVFLRISNSEIVNSRRISHLDIGLTGTIGVYLEGDVKTYASRRYVPRIKAFFGL